MSLDINQSQPQLHQQAESHISRKVLWEKLNDYGIE